MAIRNDGTEKGLTETWKDLDYEECMEELCSPLAPSTHPSDTLDPDKAARIGYGGLSWAKFIQLFNSHRTYKELWDDILNNELYKAWMFGHEIALHEARKKLDTMLQRAELGGEDKIDPSAIQGLRLLYNMTEAAGAKQEARSDSNKLMTDEEALEAFEDIKDILGTTK